MLYVSAKGSLTLYFLIQELIQYPLLATKAWLTFVMVMFRHSQHSVKVRVIYYLVLVKYWKSQHWLEACEDEFTLLTFSWDHSLSLTLSNLTTYGTCKPWSGCVRFCSFVLCTPTIHFPAPCVQYKNTSFTLEKNIATEHNPSSNYVSPQTILYME